MNKQYLIAAGAMAIGSMAIASGNGAHFAADELTAPATTSAEAEPAQASSPTCFEFRQATTFKMVDADTIKLVVGDGNEFEIDLAGPQCTALDQAKELAIQSAPIARICAGPQQVERIMKFAKEGQEAPLRCLIAAVRKAIPKKES
jgi:hypothetical protein